MSRLTWFCARSMRARSSGESLPFLSARDSIFSTRDSSPSSFAASRVVSCPDCRPCSMRCCWFTFRCTSEPVVCASAGVANAAATAAAVISLPSFIVCLLCMVWCDPRRHYMLAVSGSRRRSCKSRNGMLRPNPGRDESHALASPVGVPSADLDLLDPDQLAGAIAGVVASERASPDEAALAPDLDEIPAQRDDAAGPHALEPPRDHLRRRDEVHVRARGFDLAARDRRRAVVVPVIEAPGLADVEPAEDRLVRHPAPAEREVDRREAIRIAAAVALRTEDARLDPERGKRRDAEPVFLEDRSRAVERKLLGHARGDDAWAAHDPARMDEVVPREVRADREDRDGEPATHRHARAGGKPRESIGRDAPRLPNPSRLV